MTCRGCKDIGLLAKYYPGVAGIWFPDRLEKFVETHMQCSPHFGGVDLEGDRCFDLWAESDMSHRGELNSWMARRDSGGK